MFVQAAPNSVINCKVDVIELMGSETYLYLNTSGKAENIIARVNPRTTSRAGQTIQVAFDVNHLHFFDKETEKNAAHTLMQPSAAAPSGAAADC